MPTLTFLGVDPGTRNLGVGWIQVDARQPDRVLARGCLVLQPSSKADIASRLGFLLDGLAVIFAERQPQIVVIEKVFLGKNVQSAFTLGQARGLVLALAAKSGARVMEEAAKTAKKSVTGSGAAEKHEVQFMLARLLGMTVNETNDLAALPLDASDALALAYHGWRKHVVEARFLRSEL